MGPTGAAIDRPRSTPLREQQPSPPWLTPAVIVPRTWPPLRHT